MPTTHYQIKHGGYVVRYGGKSITNLIGTIVVTIVNQSDYVQFQSTTYTVRSRTDVVIPVTYLDGADMTCISSSQGTVTANGILLHVVTDDITVIVTNAKAKVTLNNLFPSGVASITPLSQYVPFNSTATATIEYVSGHTADGVSVSVGTVSNNTWSISVGSLSVNASITERIMRITASTTLPYITIGSIPSNITYGGAVDIPITYKNSSDYHCVTSNYGTVDASGIHVASVTDDLSINVTPVKAQVKISNTTGGTVTSVVPMVQYIALNSSAVFTLTYASGKSEADIRLVGDGTISGTTLTVPANDWINDIEVQINVLDSITIGGIKYKVVQIGDQYWMAEYLRYPTTDSIIYPTDSEGRTYGRYYSVTDIRSTLPNMLKAVGLGEWHVPSIAETNKMLAFVSSDSGVAQSRIATVLFKNSEYSSSDDRYGLALARNGFYNSSWNNVNEYSLLGEDTPTGSYANRLTLFASTWGNPAAQGDCGSGYKNIRMGIRLVRDV